RILHHLKDINGGGGTHDHAGPRRIGIDRQHAGHGDCSGNDSCRENDRDLAHGAFLSLEAQLARLLLPTTPCPDSNQPPLVFANQAKNIHRWFLELPSSEPPLRHPWLSVGQNVKSLICTSLPLGPGRSLPERWLDVPRRMT